MGTAENHTSHVDREIHGARKDRLIKPYALFHFQTDTSCLRLYSRKRIIRKESIPTQQRGNYSVFRSFAKKNILKDISYDYTTERIWNHFILKSMDSYLYIRSQNKILGINS